MMVAQLTAPARFEMADVKMRRPAAGEVRVRVIGCGVCASNIPLWQGRPWFRYPESPGSPGHEGWGFADAVGDDVADIAAGDAVAMVSTHAFAEYDVVPAECVVKLPPAVSGRPFPAEPLACAMNIFVRAELERGQHLAIVGAGFIGGILIQLACNAGVRICAVSRRSFSLEIARKCGAHELLQFDARAAEAEDIGRRRQFERVIEATGTQQGLDIASSMVGEHGRLVIAGYHQDGMRQVNLQQWNWRGIDVINAHQRRPADYVAGMRRAIDAVSEGLLDPWLLLTHQFPLRRLNEAFATMVERPDGFVKAVVVT
jgi:2-desacetyl-2-hydroxyethyl bacteriochlorophyllide A dehydrogenase